MIHPLYVYKLRSMLYTRYMYTNYVILPLYVQKTLCLCGVDVTILEEVNRQIVSLLESQTLSTSSVDVPVILSSQTDDSIGEYGWVDVSFTLSPFTLLSVTLLPDTLSPVALLPNTQLPTLHPVTRNPVTRHPVSHRPVALHHITWHPVNRQPTPSYPSPTLTHANKHTHTHIY